MQRQNKNNTKKKIKLCLECVCSLLRNAIQKPLLPSSEVFFIIFFSLHKIGLKICLMILFYNYQMLHFLFQIIKHISSFLNSLESYSSFSYRYIVSNFLHICALIVIDSNTAVRDIAKDFLE